MPGTRSVANQVFRPDDDHVQRPPAPGRCVENLRGRSSWSALVLHDQDVQVAVVVHRTPRARPEQDDPLRIDCLHYAGDYCVQFGLVRFLPQRAAPRWLPVGLHLLSAPSIGDLLIAPSRTTARVVPHCRRGNLQAVLDEQWHLLWDQDSWSEDASPDETAAKCARRLVQVVHPARARVHAEFFRAEQGESGATVERDEIRVRTVFALRFGHVRTDDASTSARTPSAPRSTARFAPSCSPARRSCRRASISIPGAIAWSTGTCPAIRWTWSSAKAGLSYESFNGLLRSASRLRIPLVPLCGTNVRIRPRPSRGGRQERSRRCPS